VKVHLRLWVLVSFAFAATACQLPVFFPEFVVNTTGAGENFADDAAMGEDGDFVVVWSESSPNAEVYGRRFDSDTTPLDGPFPVGADTAPDRVRSSIARDASGRFVIVWSESPDVWGRRFDPDGTPLGEPFQVNTSTGDSAAFPRVASDPSGNFAVTWTLGQPGEIDGVARRFDSHGAPLGDEFPVNVYTTGIQFPTGIAMSASGFVVTWFGNGSDGYGVFGRRFDETGTPVTGDLQINTETLQNELANPDVAMNAAGDFVVVWADGESPYFEALGRRYDTGATPLGDVFPISQATTGSVFDTAVSSDSAGNFLVAWTSSPVLNLGGDDAHIAARLYDMAGSATSVEFQVNAITTGFQLEPKPSLLDDGSFVIAFASGAYANFEIKGRKSAVRAAPLIAMDPSEMLTSSPTAAGNGVFEPGETQVLRTAWVNDSASDIESIFGNAALFTGPPGAVYTINDDEALYDTLPAGLTTSCLDGGDCYSVTVSDPAVRPAPHWDALLQEAFSLSLPHTWVLHIGESFPDVPTANQFYAFVETLLHNGVTGGCAGGDYCPTNSVTRAQMAVFLLKSKFGQFHIPPPCTGTVFTDVPCTGGAFDPWIEELASLQITGGCGPNLYCPGNTVTRQQMAVFLLKAFEGSAYDPPDCAGIYDDVPCTPGTGFSDWIEELANRGITGGCSVTPPLYCPTNPNNRGQMAVFLVKTFGLALYGG
jgi:hypothetical protein